MKKTILASALALAMCGILSAAEITHPMEYTLDLADGGLTEFKFVDNSQYGTKGVSTRQDNTPPDWSGLVKPNKPKKGDTVRVTGKLTFDMDIDNLYVNLVDNSAAANYWLRLSKGESSEGDTIIKDVTLFPKFLVGKPGCQEVKVIEDKIIFIKEEGKEYSIAVQATVLNEDNNNEVFIYQKFITNEDKRKNDLIFFIIMGSFAFVIIFVFILIFYIINKRKKNNPDIDDEDYNKIPVLRETINEDES